MNRFRHFVSPPSTNEITPSENYDIVQKSLFPEGYNKPFFANLSFVSFNDCTVTINEKSTILLKANVGINIENTYVYSFVIHEEGTPYYFLANY